MTLAFFLMACSSAVLSYAILQRIIGRREAVRAVRRLSPAEDATRERGHQRPRLIASAGEFRGPLTSRLLENLQLRQAAARLLEAAALRWGPAGLLRRMVALFLGGFLAVIAVAGIHSPLPALGAGTALGATPWWYARGKARRRVALFEEQFPDFLEFVSRSMRAGHAFSAAVELAYREFGQPLADELRRASEEQNLGQPLDIVLRKLCVRVPSLDVQFFVSAVLLQKRTGGNLAELLDKLAQLMRERFKLRARIRAVSAQGRMSGRILSAIPAGVGAIMFLVNPQYARFFVDDPVGHELMAGALGLQFVGYLIIRKIVTFEI
jgi:tight adherence protein B